MTPHDEPLIEFKDASVGYGRKPVLEGVNLALRRGDFWGILGYNGSGKTTLLKTLLGLIPALKGQFLARGARISLSLGARYLPPRFGYVPQKERLDPIYPLTAYAVAALGTYRRFDLRIRRWRRGHGGDRVRSALAEAGASQFSDKLYSELSGGQRQRVLIARALAAEPDILVLDEPLAGIDIRTQQSILALLQQLKEKKGLTILMVSHRIQAEKGLFTHIAWIDAGKVETGTAKAMLSAGKVTEVFRSEL